MSAAAGNGNGNGGFDDDGDDDDIVVTKTLNEQDFNCPYSTLKFKQPMMNKNSNERLRCSHHLDQDSLRALSKNSDSRNGGNSKCPVAGCNGQWNQKGNDTTQCVLDTIFLRKMERFFKNKNKKTSGSGSGSSLNVNATQLD